MAKPNPNPVQDVRYYNYPEPTDFVGAVDTIITLTLPLNYP